MMYQSKKLTVKCLLQEKLFHASCPHLSLPAGPFSHMPNLSFALVVRVIRSGSLCLCPSLFLSLSLSLSLSLLSVLTGKSDRVSHAQVPSNVDANVWYAPHLSARCVCVCGVFVCVCVCSQ